MRPSMAILFLVVAGLVASCSKDNGPERPPSGVGDLQITVMSGEAAMDHATVVVSPTSASPESAQRIASTDLIGEATIADLPSGTYGVTAYRSIAGIQHSAEDASVSVASNSTTTVVLILLESGDDYLPMTLGNWWAFDSRDTVWVGPTKVINGVTTYILGPRGEGIHPGYHSHGKNAVYMHGYEMLDGDDHIIDPPTVWIDLTATAGDCWTIRDWGEGCLESEWETVQTPYGEFTDCWKVKLQSDDSPEVWYMYLKEGVGPVKYEDREEQWLLTGFELN